MAKQPIESEPAGEAVKRSSSSRGRLRVGQANKRIIQVPVNSAEDEFVKRKAREAEITEPEVMRRGLVALKRLDEYEAKLKRLEEEGGVLALEGSDSALLKIGSLTLWIPPKMTIIDKENP